jgi:hypothetical protein
VKENPQKHGDFTGRLRCHNDAHSSFSSEKNRFAHKVEKSHSSQSCAVSRKFLREFPRFFVKKAFNRCF